MAWHSLGYVPVPVPGTPVRATTNESTPTKRIGCQTLFFEQLEANDGKIYVCDRSDAVKASGVGILAVIPAPTLVAGVAVTLPYLSATIPTSPSGMDAARFWVDADNPGEGCLVSYIAQ
jgi:hypothetical protein